MIRLHSKAPARKNKAINRRFASSDGSAWTRVVIVVAMLAAGPLVSEGLRSVLVVILIYGLFAMAYDLLLGYSDQPSLGQGLYFGLGTYGVALPIIDHQRGIISAIVIAVIAGAVVAAIIGSVAVRLTEAFYVIFTALFATIAYMIGNTLTPITGGSGGRTIDLPTFHLGPWEFSFYDPNTTYVFVAIVVAVVYLFLDRLLHSPVGEIWKAIRENPERAANIGINVYAYKLAAFVLSGALTALAGGLYALMLRFASSEFFAFTWSILPFVWVLLGGIGTLIGPLVGAAIFAIFQFYVAELWSHYMLILGVALILLLRWSPKGAVGAWTDWRRNRSKSSDKESE